MLIDGRSIVMNPCGVGIAALTDLFRAGSLIR